MSAAPSSRLRGLLALVTILAGLLLGACATAPSGAAAPDAMASAALPSNPVDPFERWNRSVFGFNEALDENVLVPVATAYQAVVPSLVRKGISNIFNNVADAWSAINALLQGKLETSMRDMMRFLVNTTFGFAGALDIAREMGLGPHYEDFGQTLGVWGVGSGPYIVWPVFGPSALRETIAMPLDRSVTPALVISDAPSQAGLTALQVINARANLLGATRVLDDIALDKYSFIRDAYLARRRNLVYDGNPPEPESLPPEERYDEPEPAPAVPSAASAPAGRS